MISLIEQPHVIKKIVQHLDLLKELRHLEDILRRER